MSLLLTMLPVYLFGNLHCMGMCGPLVMMIGHHRYRYFYFFGRIFSFTLAGMVAGGLGAVLHQVLQAYHIPALTSFLFGGVILLTGLYSLFGWHYPGYQGLAKLMSGFNGTLSLLLLRDRALPAFLFGFFTIALPCGQTLIVFSACALAGDVFIGLVNGSIFALLTTPSLFMAMHAHLLFKSLRPYYNVVMGGSALFIGGLAICRGFAEIGLIPHLVLNPESALHYHIILY